MDQTHEQNHTEAAPNRPSSRALWFGLLSGPIIWTVQFLAVYLLVEVACQAGILRGSFLGMETISFLVVLLTVASLIGVAYGGFFSYRNYQQVGGHGIFQRQNLDRSPAWFMALSGLALSLLFGLLILMMGIPAVVLAPCVR